MYLYEVGTHAVKRPEKLGVLISEISVKMGSTVFKPN